MKTKKRRYKHDCNMYRKPYDQNPEYDVCQICGRVLHKSKQLDLNSKEVN